MRGQQFVEPDHRLDDDAPDTGPGSELTIPGPMVVTRPPRALTKLTHAELAAQQARRLPYLATAATEVVGSAAWGAAELAAMAGQPALSGHIVVGTWIAAGAGVVALRVWFRNRILDGWRRTWWTAALGGAAGVDVLAAASSLPAVGSFPALAAPLAGVAATGALIATLSGWMAAHPVTIPIPPPPRRALPVPPPPPAIEPPPPPAPPPVPVDPRHPLHRKWDERVAAGDKVVLKGAELIPLDLLPQAAKWKIDTNGDFTFDEIAAAQRKIAARLLVLARNVIIERDGEEEGSALLTIVLVDTVLTADLTYPGPQYIDGRIPVAMAADGTGWLYHVADDPEKGCQSGMIVGEPGAGKTAAMETVVAGCRKSGVWDVLYADGDPGGGSSHVLNTIAHRAFAGPMGALRVLEAMEAVIEYRSRLKPWLVIDLRTGLIERIPEGSPIPEGTEPVRDMHATHQYHGVLGVIDEFKRHLGDQRLKEVNFAERVENVEQIGRKYGVRWLITTQSLLAGHWGLRTNLRSWVAAMNAWIMRSQNQSEGNVLNGVAGAASSLPKRVGSCYAAGSDRMVLARVAWEKGLDRYAPQFPTARGDRGTEMAIAVALDHPRHRAGIDDLDGGDGPSLEEIEAALAAGRNPFVPEPEKVAAKPAQQPAAAGQPKLQSTRFTTPSGVGIPAPLTGATITRLRPRPAPTAVPALTAKAEQVQAMLRSRPGSWTTGELEEATGLSKPDVSKALAILVARGQAHRPTGKTGTYQTGPAPVGQHAQ